jgi:single-strand DNA-binding protein
MLIGRLGKDPELSYLPSGQSVAKFTMATNRSYKDKSGEWKEETDWHNIVAWGKTGETCAQYLKKGGQAYVEGRIQTRNWEDREGKKRTTTEIIAENVVLLGSKGDGGGGGGEGMGRPTAAVRSGQPAAPDDDFAQPEITDDDIPF